MILEGCFGPFDTECRRVLGFTAGEVWQLVQAIPKVIEPRIEPLLHDARRKHTKDLWRRYQAHRGRWVEQMAAERLRAVLPASSRWTGIEWTGASDTSDLDGLVIEVVVCLDDITVWSTETHKLRRLVSVPNTEQVPGVLSLADLMATTDLLSGAELAHFLTRRQRLEREGRIEAHDELDWVGHYISDGLYFDDYLDGPDAPDVFRLTSYTEPIDSWYFSRAGLTATPFPKPVQPLPRGLDLLIRRLEHDRPRHWIMAAVLLLNGDEKSRQLIAEFLGHTSARALQVGWSNASQRFDSYGLTLWADRRYAGPDIVRLLREYVDQKIVEYDRPNWVALGLGRDGRLTVVVRDATGPNPRAWLAAAPGSQPRAVDP